MRYIQFDDRVIDLESGQIHHQGETTQLPPRLLILLKYFAEHGGEVISRDQLITAVWGHLEAATDDSVNVAVSSLRRAIGDDRRPHRILKAVPRRGYLFESSAGKELDSAAAQVAITAPHETVDAPIQLSEYRHVRVGLLMAAALLATTAGLLWFQPWQDTVSDQEIGRAVAVLPFTDMTTEADHGPFADGLADRIIHKLTLSPDLEVTARTSSFTFRDSPARIGEIGQALGVDVVLEGSVQRADDQIRVLAQLIDVDTDMHLWSKTYDRPIGELFELQDDIANAVAITMTNTLLPEPDTLPANSQQVWELITRGRIALDRLTVDSVNQAVDYFQQVLELEPDNVDGLIGMTDALTAQRSLGPMRTHNDTVDITLPFLQRAQFVAGDSAAVIRATGDWHFNHNRPDKAIESYRLALERNPNDSMSWRNLGRVLFRQARYNDAIEPLKKAVKLDPYMGVGQVWLADAYWATGRAEEALYRLRDFIAKQPDVPQPHDRLATYLAQTGETGQAMRHIFYAQSLDPDSPVRKFRICEFWLQLGDHISAERCTDEFAAAFNDEFRIAYLRQIVSAFRADFDAQIQQLELAVSLNERDPLTPAILAQAYSINDCGAALDLLQVRFPGLFEPEPELTTMQLLPARTAVYCLQQTGQGNEADELLAAHSELVERTRIEQGPWMVAGHELALDYALHGQYDAALSELEDLVNSNWRYYWWGLEHYPELKPIVDHPRFIALQQKLEQGVREQREYFEANQERPIF